jgi:hypothetical protein
MEASMSSRKSAIGVAALVLPVVILAAVAGNASLQQNVGQHLWRVKISAYDPRDLLYGHYLTYRYDWTADGRIQTPAPANESCLCLNSSGNGSSDPKVHGVSCSVPAGAACESVITAPAMREKYMIPEHNAERLESLFRSGNHDFHVEIMAHNNQSVSVRGLYVDDVALEDYLRSMPDMGPVR